MNRLYRIVLLLAVLTLPLGCASKEASVGTSSGLQPESLSGLTPAQMLQKARDIVAGAVERGARNTAPHALEAATVALRQAERYVRMRPADAAGIEARASRALTEAEWLRDLVALHQGGFGFQRDVAGSPLGSIVPWIVAAVMALLALWLFLTRRRRRGRSAATTAPSPAPLRRPPPVHNERETAPGSGLGRI